MGDRAQMTGAARGDQPADRPLAAVVRVAAAGGNRAFSAAVLRSGAGQGAGPLDPAIAAWIQGARGSGRPLGEGVRDDMQARFGADLSSVRIHTGATADTLSRAVQAEAFTTGSDIFFRAGRFTPDSDSGRLLLAHELTHVVQQPSASAGGQLVVTAPDDAAEVEAAAVAKAVVSRSSAAEAAEPSSRVRRGILRFASHEHRDIGQEATGGGVTVEIDLGDGERLTYGEMVALAGDYFESLAQMQQLAGSPSGQEELRAARWDALHVGSAQSPEATKRMKDRYYTLAARNLTHFSAGGTARTEYERYHREALAQAFYAGASEDPSYATKALTTEAFGNHYLTDMFSAGHVRTPRQEIKEWYDAMFPDSVDRFVSYIATKLTENLERQGDLNWFTVGGWGIGPRNWIVEWQARGIVRDLGGPALQAFGLGDLVSLAYHNLDNKGLGVVSDVDENGVEVPGGYRWMAKGDDLLATSEITQKMVVAAVRESLVDLAQIRQQGVAAGAGQCLGKETIERLTDGAIAELTPYQAERYIPREDPTANNLQLNWHWGELSPELRASLDQAISGTVAGTLRGKASSVGDSSGVIEKFGLRLNARQALLDFADYLAAQGTVAIEEAMSTAASAETGGHSMLPTDAGVPLPAGVPEPPAGSDRMDAGVPTR